MALIASTKERPFGVEERFVVATDATGRIRMADPVFVRLSGYAHDELIGRGVDRLRHPEVPRALFEAPLAPGPPGAGYLKCVAKDGAHFWAMVGVIPIDDGRLMVGFKPATPWLDVARDLHQQLRAAQPGADRLGSWLAAAGHADHDAFMRIAFVAEVAARGAVQPRVDGALREPAIGAAAVLKRFSDRLAGYGALSETLRRKSGFVEALAESIRLFSLNAILAAHRVADRAAIGAVAGLMQTRSDAAAPEILALGTEIDHAETLLSETSFRTALGRLLTDVLLAGEEVRVLAEPIAETLEAVSASMQALEAALDRLAGVSHAVEEHLKTIRFLELQGRIEAARATDTEHVRVLFEEVGRQVRAAGDELRDISALDARPRDDRGSAREASRLAAALRGAPGAGA